MLKRDPTRVAFDVVESIYMTQDEALSILKTGAHIFLTGEPGSGKTHTVNAYVRYLREHGIEPSITASTGIAATHIGGMTIHAWSGIGVRSEITEYDLDAIMQNERTVKRIRHASVLIIDEVSMLSARTLTMVEVVCRTIRGNGHAFGGLQIVVVGDFFQLPPIVPRQSAPEDTSTIYLDEHHDSPSAFAYQSSAWRALNPIVCYLSEQHRQEDRVFLDILTALRAGDVSSSHRSALVKRHTKEAPSGITRLFSHNADVDRINDDELKKVPGPAKAFKMRTHGSAPLSAQLMRTCLSPEILSLKVGARVMFTKNDPQGGYVNGTTGTVTAFRSDSYPIVETNSGVLIGVEPVEWALEADGKVLASITQVPLRLAWAITVHKSQGMSLDAAVIDLSRAFEYGQGYVALSRVRTLAGLHLLGINERAFEVHPEVSTQDTEFHVRSEAASETFNTMSREELTQLHYAFIQSCGGTLESRAQQSHMKKTTIEETQGLIPLHPDIESLARARSLTPATILTHLEALQRSGNISEADLEKFTCRIPDGDRQRLYDAFKKLGSEKLRPVFDLLDKKYPFETIRLARLLYESEK